jgi:hypothetical protein
MTSITLAPKNWDSFQHYKDRAPAWIKLHKGLLNDFAFARLPVDSRALAPMLWLLASEYEGGRIVSSLPELAFRLHMIEGELAKALNPLIESGFFIVDSGSLAPCRQDAIPEKEGEREKQGKKEGEKNIRAVADATRTIPRPEDFARFWEEYPKREGGNPKKTAAIKFFTKVRQGADPEAIIAGARLFAADVLRLGTEPRFVAQAVTWLSQERWQDYTEAPAAAVNSEARPIGWRPGMPTDEELRRQHEADDGERPDNRH